MAGARELAIVAPHLSKALEGTGQGAHMHAVYKALQRAASATHDYLSPEALLTRVLGYPPSDHSLPVARDLAAVLNATVSADSMVWCADPVHLRADPNQVLLFSAAHFPLAENEADSLLTELNSAFAGTGIRFSRGRLASQWFVEAGDVPARPSVSSDRVDGRMVSEHLPGGPVDQLMTEAQMVLHQSDVNDARVAAGQPPVNSVWIWGAGEAAGAPPDEYRCYGDSPLLAALARANNWRYECAINEQLDDNQRTLWYLGAARWEEVADQVAAACKALRSRAVARLEIYSTTRRFTLTRANQRRFWRRSRP